MSHFECRLNRRFCRSKTVVKIVQIGGGRGGGDFGRNPKEQQLFSWNLPKIGHFYRASYLNVDVGGSAEHVGEEGVERPSRPKNGKYRDR